MDNLNIYIVGPCSVESSFIFGCVAEKMTSAISDDKNWYLKGSFDKANRTSVEAPRGPGIYDSIDIFEDIKEKFPNIKITTDIHEPWQAEKLRHIVDMVQVPAFLCRQTDLIRECAHNFDVINVKKGQWMDPGSMRHVVEKIRYYNEDAKVYITERGTQFGYDRVIVDYRAVDIMKEFCDGVILDCTHSTQQLGQGTTGGNRNLAKAYVKTAREFGYDGIFAETHPAPDTAISDKDSQIDLEWMASVINTI